MTLASYIRIVGRGPARARPLTRAEAHDAMDLILSGEAAPEAVGALLMLLRYRGEVPDEIAGFTDALRAGLNGWGDLSTALDWPTYAAGRSRGAPWFLLSAKLVAMAGYPVFLHGWNSHQNEVASVRDALQKIGISQATDAAGAAQNLTLDGITYVPVEALHAPALELLKLRDVLGLRSCLNTVLRMMNPTNAPAMVQGVFHPPYRTLQSDAAQMLGQPALSVIKGGGGEFERHPAKLVTVMGLRDGFQFETTAAPLLDETRRLHDQDLPAPAIDALWRGEVEDEFAASCIIGTAALALTTCGLDETKAHDTAKQLWAERNGLKAA